MKLRVVISFFPLLMSSSCSQNIYSLKLINFLIEDPLNTEDYTYYTFRVRQDSTANSSDEGSNYVMFKYPYFENQNDLNNALMRRLSVVFPHASVVDTSFEQFAKSFFNKHRRHSVFHSVKGYAGALNRGKNLLTIGMSVYSNENDTIHRTSFMNWDTKANKIILLDDLFKVGYQSDLIRIGKSYDDKNFILTNNYFITQKGIIFIYDKSEMGTEDDLFFIPYGEIRSLLKPNTVINQYIN